MHAIKGKKVSQITVKLGNAGLNGTELVFWPSTFQDLYYIRAHHQFPKATLSSLFVVFVLMKPLLREVLFKTL